MNFSCSPRFKTKEKPPCGCQPYGGFAVYGRKTVFTKQGSLAASRADGAGGIKAGTPAASAGSSN